MSSPSKLDSENQRKDIENITTNRLLSTTSKGYIALVPKQAKDGDHIVVLYGGFTPFVWRLKEGTTQGIGRERRWQLIGEAYVHRFMDGEAVDDLNDGDGKEEDFILV